jgi:hypothetical protein
MGDEKKKNSPKGYQAIQLFLGCLLISIVWLIFSIHQYESYCPPDFQGNHNSTDLVSYSVTLSRYHRYDTFNLSLIAFIIFDLVVFIYYGGTNHILLALLMLPAGVFAFLLLYVGIIFCDESSLLYHADTIEFDGRMYHIAIGEHASEYSYDFLVLFECELNRDECREQILYNDSGIRLSNSRLEIVDEQLRVIASGEIIFRIDKKRIGLPSMPTILKQILKPSSLLRGLFHDYAG